MVARCDREVRLAEQRRREKVEQQTEIKIKLVIELDICGMSGFWDHTLIQPRSTYKMGREQLVKDLMEDLSSSSGIDPTHMALFVLQCPQSVPQLGTADPIRVHAAQQRLQALGPSLKQSWLGSDERRAIQESAVEPP
ncbi:unnamed protein product [Effrenium voratum]|nr:unnamed protein product [Effrenium voratum]